MPNELQQLITGIEALIRAQLESSRLQETSLELTATQNNEKKVQNEALAKLLIDLKSITEVGNESIISVLLKNTEALSVLGELKASVDALVTHETSKEEKDTCTPIVNALEKTNTTLESLLEESRKETITEAETEDKGPQKVEIVNFPQDKEKEGPEEVIVKNEIKLEKPAWYQQFSYTKITDAFKTMLGSLVFRIKPEETLKVFIVDEKGKIINDFSPTIVNRGGDKNGSGGGPSQVGLMSKDGQTINPATLESIQALSTSTTDAVNDMGWQLERLLHLLKPLGIVTGAGSNRLSVDINNIVGGLITTVTTVTTLTTLTTLANQTNFGGVNAFTQQQSILRSTYAVGISNNLIFS